ncbi:amidase [Cohnella thailandensis]|uniref:amidase n=1 Tax=Cohnella thailandensis TaxID=557557 RepID=UPI001AE7EC8F|nr:amidase [Cohnella thailandensis]MBP1977631.1 amidase [Cohnella thailandensis]
MNEFGAYMIRSLKLASTGRGSLTGLTFAVKDVFDIEGHVSSAGNPDWLRTHPPAGRTAPSILALLAEGAKMEGVTHTDELMFSLNGENAHYGTPINPRARGCIPGGSSSGSAVAVASGSADFALGTDTGGSVRIPASYCGIYGFRPSHGAISVEGVIPLAESFDTVGVLAAEPSVLEKAGAALLGGGLQEEAGGLRRIRFVKEAWALANPRFEGLPEGWLAGLAELGMECEWIELAPEGLSEWSSTFRELQGHEIWRRHGRWIEETKPNFAPDIAGRFEGAKIQSAKDIEDAKRRRQVIREKVESILGDDGLLLIPTAPGSAPALQLPAERLEGWRSGVLQLTCIAGLTGLPQIQIPLDSHHEAPIGISAIAGRGQDRKLLAWVRQLVESRAVELVAHSRTESAT